MASHNKDVGHKIPVINFSEENMKPGSDSWKSAREKVRKGLEEYGCFEVVWDDFPQHRHNSIFEAAKDLLDLPAETKRKKVSLRPGARNFIERPGPNSYETFGIDEPTTQQGVEYFTNIMWPQGNTNFCETVHSYSSGLVKISEMTTRMVAESYGVNMEKYRSVMESSFNSLRFIRYRSEVANESGFVMGLPTHTDSSFLTIMHQHHEIGGIQVHTEGDHLIDVKPSCSSFLVLAGDVLMAWSNERVKSCVHRVIMKEMNKVRHSVGFFMFLKGVVSVPEELVDDEHPLLYKPFNHFEYLSFFLTDEARKFDSCIKGFCGI